MNEEKVQALKGITGSKLVEALLHRVLRGSGYVLSGQNNALDFDKGEPASFKQNSRHKE